MKQTKKLTEETRRLIKKFREFKMKNNDPKSRVRYAELCKAVRIYVTEDIRKFNCDLVKNDLEENKSLTP